MSWGLLLTALALDHHNERRADQKRKRLIDTHERKNVQHRQDLADNSIKTAMETHAQPRQARYQKNADQLEGEILDLVGENSEPYAGNDISDQGGTEQARRSAERTQRQVDMARLLSRFNAGGATQLQGGTRLAEGASTAQGIGSNMQDDYSRFARDYNNVRADPTVSAISSIMKGAAIGGMYGGTPGLSGPDLQAYVAGAQGMPPIKVY